jgi:2-keto-4-pentenoate hydratase/2-oxohepta-3-ene-1,7-dioic acid hydratase in catechol pathway
MRIATYRSRNRVEVGIVSEDGSSVTPYDLPGDTADSGVLALIEANHTVLPLRQVTHPLDDRDVELLAPIPRPRRNIICVGKNYYDHVQEIARHGFDTTGGGAQAPTFPIIFSKFPECVSASGQPIRYDARVTQQLDYEAELGVIIGREGRAISQVDAMDFVWGYTIINDVTARDVQKRHVQWLLGKSQDGFCPMGPFVVTRDGLDLADTPIRCWVNDELRQDGNTNLMMFDIPTLIESISAGITLYPGDVIATGTPAGVGAGFEPPRFLEVGDRVRVEIPTIGTLQNQVVAW